MSLLLQFIESFLAIPCLVTASLRHTAHPVELGTVEIRRPSHFCPRHLQPLGTFLEVIGIVAMIGIDGLFVELKDDGADAVEEVAVVRHHEQRDVGAREVVLEPLYHLQVEVVRRLVEDEQVGLHDERVGKSHALQLSAGKLRERLVELRDEELREDGLGTVLVVPGLLLLHAVQDVLQALLTGGCHAGLVLADEVRRLVAVPEACLDDGQVKGIVGSLLQVADAKVIPEDDLPLVCLVLAAKDVQQRTLARAVLGDEPHFLSLAYAE